MRYYFTTLLFLLVLVFSACGAKTSVNEADTALNGSDSSVSEKRDDIVQESQAITPTSVEEGTRIELDSVSSEYIDDDNIYFNSAPIPIADVKSNISVETEIYEDCMAVLLTNNNNFVIPDLELTVLFYNNSSMIDSDSDGHDVLLPGVTVVSRIDVPKNADEFEVSFDVDWDYGTTYRNWRKNVTYESNIGNDNVMIKFTNNGDVDIRELEYVVLFYKNGNFVGMSYCTDVSNSTAGSTVIEEVSSYGIKDFDDYKIFINQAHTF